MVAGGGEMGDAPGVSRVLLAALAACLTYPLCKGYFREASAFGRCGHTFCREFIMKKIDEEEIESCPVCDAALGIAPEEKLRADEKMQAIRDKVFPPETEVEDCLRESQEADSHEGITTPVWFSLVTAPKQVKAKQLPQMENNFYRIKDGTMQVSSILKLIIKKLELASDIKVEILCHDKSDCPSTTLHGLLKRWLSCKPKDKVQRPVGGSGG